MRFIFGVLILLLAYFLAKSLITEVKNIEREQQQPETKQAPPNQPAELPGLPPALEPSLQAAEQQGVDGLRVWLSRYGRYVSDPRLASIQLDYVLLLSARDPVQAKRLFDEVKARTPPTSPVYPRIRSLEETYR